MLREFPQSIHSINIRGHDGIGKCSDLLINLHNMVVENIGDADLQVKDGRPALVADVQQVPEALAGDQAASLAFPLQQCIGSDLANSQHLS